MKLPRRRRLEAKTDYSLRLGLLKSEKTRLVVRKTNRYIIVQLVETTIAQDKVITGLSSKELVAKGWPKDKEGSLKNLPAAYVTGFLVGKAAQAKKISSAILDIGMNRNIHKSRIYAAIKGVIDSGLKVPCGEQCLPTLDEINKNKEFTSIITKLTKQ